MKKFALACSLLVLSLLLTGCVVRTYQATKDRVDQNLTLGNRGYLMGQPSAGEEKERKMTRSTQVVEIELRSPIRFEKAKSAAGETGSTETGMSDTELPATKVEVVAMQQYTVGKNDTLQKISQKFYGTTKKWKKIYNANKDKLKGPDKVYPGQVLDIPAEDMLKEPSENLK